MSGRYGSDPIDVYLSDLMDEHFDPSGCLNCGEHCSGDYCCSMCEEESDETI